MVGELEALGIYYLQGMEVNREHIFAHLAEDLLMSKVNLKQTTDYSVIPERDMKHSSCCQAGRKDFRTPGLEEYMEHIAERRCFCWPVLNLHEGRMTAEIAGIAG